MSFTEGLSDLISIGITIMYMVIIWVVVDKMKWLSVLTGIHKKPLYLIIIIATIIPIFIILKYLFNSKLPFEINVRAVGSPMTKLKQMSGIENKFILPSNPENKYRDPDVANKDSDEDISEGIENDVVYSQVVDNNYFFGSPQDSKSRFVMKGKVCGNADFSNQKEDEDGNPLEMVKVKWDLIANQNPRYCLEPGCADGGDLNKYYGNINVNNINNKKPEHFDYKIHSVENECLTPYMKINGKKIGNEKIANINYDIKCAGINCLARKLTSESEDGSMVDPDINTLNDVCDRADGSFVQSKEDNIDCPRGLVVCEDDKSSCCRPLCKGWSGEKNNDNNRYSEDKVNFMEN